MASVTALLGEPVATEVRSSVTDRVDRLREHGPPPTLGTVLASDTPADEGFLELKHEAAASLGIEVRDERVAPLKGRSLAGTVSALSDDPTVDAIFVQAPLPEGIDEHAVRGSIARGKDVDCFHPENIGRLVTGWPRFVPATTAAVLELLDWYEIPTEGQDVVIVGRSSVIGRPMANRLLYRDATGNATVTVCHSLTENLGEKTRGADIVVTVAGTPGLVDGSMLTSETTVIDVSATRREVNGQVAYEGDVDADSAEPVVSALTPVPGGVGPVTVAALLQNVVLAAERRRGIDEPSPA